MLSGMRFFLLSMIVLSPEIQIYALGGNSGGNGGDFEKALVKAGLVDKVAHEGSFSPEFTERVKNEFFAAGVEGLIALEILHTAGLKPTRPDGQLINLNSNLIVRALRKLKEIVTVNEKFSLDNSIEVDGRTVTAKNFPDDQRIVLNPLRWSQIEFRYSPRYQRILRSVIAVHEVLSLLPNPIENTDDYSLSLKLMDFSLKPDPSQETRKKSEFPKIFPTLGPFLNYRIVEEIIISDLWYSGRETREFENSEYVKHVEQIRNKQGSTLFLARRAPETEETLDFLVGVSRLYIEKLARGENGKTAEAKLSRYILAMALTELYTQGRIIDGVYPHGMVRSRLYSEYYSDKAVAHFFWEFWRQVSEARFPSFDKLLDSLTNEEP